ncbi:MAG TPA: hypothetical protein VGB98_00155 [Pyrinomonadaceae bacterium]|jgi:hypothetical protein
MNAGLNVGPAEGLAVRAARRRSLPGAAEKAAELRARAQALKAERDGESDCAKFVRLCGQVEQTWRALRRVVRG